MSEFSSASVEALLGSPTTYGLPSDAIVTRMDTHISVIFLAGDFAYKLKKRLDLSYLDFTTLEARRWACERELTLNQRTAPTLYLETVPITSTEDGLVLGAGEGEIVDWVVKMERFDQACLLSHMANRGALPTHIVEELARNIETFHRGAEVSTIDGGQARVAEILESNQKNFNPFVGSVYPQELIADLATMYAVGLDVQGQHLEERKAGGWVRHCHGDLHLNNVVYLNETPIPFDCIEFNDKFARIDTLYDFAFLLMDLAFRARSDERLSAHANAALNAYLQKNLPNDLSDSLRGLAALPFFMSIRASVRSHVNARMIESGGGEGVALAATAVAYAEFALELLAPAEPKLYAIGGLSGTGKTTVAKALAPELGCPVGAVHLRTDIIRKRLAGVRDEERLPPSAYTLAASDQVYAEMSRLAGLALDAGRSVVCDAVFAKFAEREAIEEVSKSRSIPFQGVWLVSPAQELEARVEARARSGRDASDANVSVVKQQLDYDLGDLHWVSVDTGTEFETALARVRAELNLSIG